MKKANVTLVKSSPVQSASSSKKSSKVAASGHSRVVTMATLDAMPLQAAGDEWSEAQKWTRAAVMFEKGKTRRYR